MFLLFRVDVKMFLVLSSELIGLLHRLMLCNTWHFAQVVNLECLALCAGLMFCSSWSFAQFVYLECLALCTRAYAL